MLVYFAVVEFNAGALKDDENKSTIETNCTKLKLHKRTYLECMLHGCGLKCQIQVHVRLRVF